MVVEVLLAAAVVDCPVFVVVVVTFHLESDLAHYPSSAVVAGPHFVTATGSLFGPAIKGNYVSVIRLTDNKR